MAEVEHDEAGQRMPFLEHLAELRTRLRNSVLGVLLGTAIAYMFRAQLFRFFAQPLIVAWNSANVPPEARRMIFTDPIEGFMVMFKLSLLVGIFLGSPVIFTEIWRFVAPGLYPRERRFALPFVIIAVLLFFGGAAFAYLYVLPKGYTYFLGYGTNDMTTIRDVLAKDVTMGFKIDPQIKMDEYWGLTTKLLLVFGAVFELPLVLGILSILGIVTPQLLWRFNRYAILISFVAGAVLTPGDLVVGQMAMGVALTVLYNISILISFLVGRRRRAEALAEDQPPTAAA